MSALKITILGCGSSFGVPLFHNIWGKCDPKEPKNIRSRPSILIQKNGKNLLIDTSPDLKPVSYTHLTLPTNREV